MISCVDAFFFFFFKEKTARACYSFQVEKVRDDMRTAGMTPSEEYLQDSPDTTGSCALDINSVQTVMEI